MVPSAAAQPTKNNGPASSLLMHDQNQQRRVRRASGRSADEPGRLTLRELSVEATSLEDVFASLTTEDGSDDAGEASDADEGGAA